MPVSSLHYKDLKFHLHPQTDLLSHQKKGPHVFVEGKGIYVRDEAGREYIEGVSGLWCASLGFSESRLAEAANKQLLELPFYHNFSHRTVPVVANLAEKLISISPDPMSKVFFTNSGSEAVDSMVKIVWYYNNVRGLPEKKKIISRHGAYHGITVVASSLTGLSYAHELFDTPIDRFLHVSCPHYYHSGAGDETETEYATRLAVELEELILEEGPGTIAAFVAEPIMGAGGVLLPPETYFDKIQAVLRKYDILFVADEVICGFGRTGNGFGSETCKFVPDIMIVAKALSAGYMPIGGVLITDDIYETLVEGSRQVGIFGAGFTYSGHPVSCAVALETLRIYEERQIFARVRDITPHFLARLNAFSDHPLVGETRGIGLIGGVELVKDKVTRKNFDPALKVGHKVTGLAAEKGLLVRPLRNDTIAFCPPLIISREQIDEMFDLFGMALDEAAGAINTAM